MDPTDALNLPVDRCFVVGSPVTRSTKYRSKNFLRIGGEESAADVRSADPTLFSNLMVAVDAGTAMSSSCVHILGVPRPESTTNLWSLKRTTSDWIAFPADNRMLEFDCRNTRFM